MQKQLIRHLLFLFLLLLPGTVSAQFEGKEEFERLYREYIDLYNSGKNEQFYEAADRLCDYYKRENDLQRYYTMQLNICLYDIEHNMTYKALKRANEMTEEMEQANTDYYEMVYLALGSVYESRGNYHLARYYFEKTLEHIKPGDHSNLIGTQLRLANLLMLIKPEEARKWNDKYTESSKRYPEYQQIHLFVRGVIDFATNNENDFSTVYDQFQRNAKNDLVIDNYGKETMEIIKLVFEKRYDEAASMLKRPVHELTDVNRLDMLLRIYVKAGNTEGMVGTFVERALLIDSLNSDILFDNINEINAQAGLNRANKETSQARETTFFVVFFMSVIIIIILSVCVFIYQKNKQRLKERNDQLQTALMMAEESEKMKNEFVCNVSHEIRTPLNAINGFTSVLNTPDFKLSTEQRMEMTQRINDNIEAITRIVDDMLALADKESNEFYPKSGKVYLNKYLSALLYDHRKNVSSHIELLYTTDIINRFQLETNEEGLRKVVEHLIQNATKFTQKGFIKLHCEFSPNKQQVLISVADTGCGISEEQRSKIFDDFYKGDSFRQGIGLGLAVSRKIARKLGGDLTFDETYAEGARFVLALPVE